MLPSVVLGITIAERLLTILEDVSSPAKLDQPPEVLALSALAWILEDSDRARRLLETTGLDPVLLRDALGDQTTLAAVLEFLANYEPDLIRAAEALAVAPEELIKAMKELRG